MNEQFDIVEHQNAAYEALLELDRILKKNNIQYYLLAGSVLGAVRHGGFIPWDDDIDVGIKVEDYERASHAIQQELSETYTWIDKSCSTSYPRLYGKILHDSLGCIDVFKLVKTSNNPKERTRQWRYRKIFFKLYKAKVGYAHKNEKLGLKNSIKLFFSKIISCFIPMETLNRMIDNNEKKYQEISDNDYYINLYSIYSLEKELIKSEWLEQPGEVQFNAEKFSTVGNTDDYLKHLYGDYMKLPPVEERKARHSEEF